MQYFLKWSRGQFLGLGYIVDDCLFLSCVLSSYAKSNEKLMNLYFWSSYCV
jgi:hypothetical protein